MNIRGESGDIAVINISNLTETGIDYSGVGWMEAEEKKIEKIYPQGRVVLAQTFPWFPRMISAGSLFAAADWLSKE